MSVTSSNLHREGWTGTGRVTGGNRFSVSWLVETDDKNDGPLSVALGALNASPDPVGAIWSTYSVGNDSDIHVVCKERSTRLHGYTQDGAIWIVTNTYEAPGHQQEDDAKTNPLLRPVKYHIEWANYTRVVEEDINGDPIVNSAGQKFLDPIERDDARPVLVARYNVATLAQIIALGMTFKNAVNTNTFWGAAPRHAKVQSITASDLQEENGVQYYEITIRVEFNDDTWDVVLPDQGLCCENALGNLVVCVGDDGYPVGEPVPLDGTGLRLAAGEDLQFLTFRIYPERDFSALGI